MNLLQRIKPARRDHHLNLVDNCNIWSQGEQFSEMVKKELNRSRRSGLPISSVLIDLSTDETIRISDRRYRRFFRELVKILTDKTRFFDIKYVLSPYKIGILLIDTNLEGAKAFIAKISRIVRRHYEMLGIPDYEKFIESTEITISPIGEAEDFVTITSSLVSEEPGTLDLAAGEENRRSLPREDFELTLDWRTAPSSKNDMIQKIDGITNSHCSGRCVFCYRTIKRLIDVVGSIAGIILFSPLMVLIAIAIKVTSRGPVLFRQRRIGYLGESFTFLKFRTMITNGDDSIHREYVKRLVNGLNEEVNLGTRDEPLYKLDNDSRVTKVGWLLRKTSLDELPQFFNVLSGSMSLVGPRPAIFYEADEYKNWHWLRVMETKPGITGIWQVSGRSRTTFDEMVRLDLQYIEKQSTVLDLKLLLKTFGAVLNTKGAL